MAGNKSYWPLHTIAAALIIFIIGAANGRPSVFPDTAWYYSQGEYLASRLGIQTGRSLEDRNADPTSVMPNSQAMQERIPITVSGGRSPFYGLMLVIATEIGTLWLLAAIQALVAAWIICVLVRTLFDNAEPKRYYGLILLLSLFTSLPFYTAFAMPDLFTGLLIICINVIAVYPDKMNLISRISFWIIIMLSISFHNSNSLLAVVLLAVNFILLIVLKKTLYVVAVRTAWIGTAIAAALLSGWVFGIAYQVDAGVAQRTPPFLMARLIADGPGRDYLSTVCPGGASPTLCRFQGRPMSSEDEILWSENPDRGVFNISDYNIRTKLKNEELAFIIAVVRRDPLGTFHNIIRNGLIQLGEFYVLEPLRNPASFTKLGWWRRTAIEQIVPRMDECERNPETCNPRADGVLLAVLHIAAVVASTCLISYTLLRIFRSGLLAEESKVGRDDLRLFLCAGILLVLGVVLNAFICGGISGHFARYQARVVWIVPLVAFLILDWKSISDKIIYPASKNTVQIS